ncbi:hypothetical protein ANCDUO_19948, partial [Ancylostoma duodenale]
MSMPQWRALESNPDSINAYSPIYASMRTNKMTVTVQPPHEIFMRSVAIAFTANCENMDVESKFMNKIGVRGVECVDVFSFEPEMLDFVPSPQLALILCFPEKD